MVLYRKPKYPTHSRKLVHFITTVYVVTVYFRPRASGTYGIEYDRAIMTVPAQKAFVTMKMREKIINTRSQRRIIGDFANKRRPLKATVTSCAQAPLLNVVVMLMKKQRGRKQTYIGGLGVRS